MAARKDLLAKVLEAITKKGRGSLHGGSIQSGTLDDLALLNEQYVKGGLFLPEHAIFSRFDKTGWSPERIAESYGALMNESATRGVPNFTGGNRAGAEALWLENGPTSLFSPVIPHKGGSMSLTIMEPYTSRVKQNLEEVGWTPGERHFSPSDVTTAHIGSRSANSLRSGAAQFSAVGSQPTLSDILSDVFNEVKNSKKVLPFALAGGASTAALHPTEAQASNLNGMDSWDTLLQSGYVTPDKPLETPLFDPIDNIISALTGPAGMAGKATAAALETPFSLALNAVLEGAGKAHEWMGQRGPQMQGAWF